MNPALRIHRFHNIVRVPAQSTDPAGASRRVTTLRWRVAELFEERLSSVRASLGLPPEAIVVVRRLSLRLVLRGRDFTDGQLAIFWADALGDSLRGELEHLVGTVGENVAVFESRGAAEELTLRRRMEGHEQDWWPSLALGEGGTEPVVILRGWIREHPRNAPQRILDLVQSSPGGFARLLSPDQLESLVDELLEVRRARWQAVVGQTAPASRDATLLRMSSKEHRMLANVHGMGISSQRLVGLCALLSTQPALAPFDRSVLERTLQTDGLVSPTEDGLAEIDRAAPAATLSEPARSSQFPSPAELQPGTTSRDAGIRAGERSGPSDAVEGPPATVSTPGTRTDAVASMTEREVEPGRPGRSLEPDIAAATMSRRARESRAPAERMGSSAAREQASASMARDRGPFQRAETSSALVGCAGLLYLIRPIARLPIVQDHRPGRDPPLDRLLLTLSMQLLDPVLAPLTPNARRAALRRERPLLAVFTGAPELADDPFDSVDPPSEVSNDALDWILSHVPEQLAPAPDGFALTLGESTGRFQSDMRRRLAHLLLRIGRLEWSETHADLYMSLSGIDVAVRFAGWDVDPGWVPHLGRVIRFHYEERIC